VKLGRPSELERTRERRTMSFSSPWYASTVERTSPSRPHAAKPARSAMSWPTYAERTVIFSGA